MWSSAVCYLCCLGVWLAMLWRCQLWCKVAWHAVLCCVLPLLLRCVACDAEAVQLLLKGSLACGLVLCVTFVA